MAYGIRYQFSFDSQNGDGVDIFILQRNYSGQRYVRALGRAPILKRERNDRILGTSLEIYAESRVDGEFAVLYTSDAYEFKVAVYKRQVLIWTGFVSPELYAEPDIAPPYDVQIIATDGLGELKNYDFIPSERIGTYRRYIDDCLRHTGLDLDIDAISGLSYYDDGWDESNGLLSIVTDFSHKTGVNCYDVLQSILASVNAIVTQNEGKWVILRESDIYAMLADLNAIEFGSMETCDWWPIGNLSIDTIPAKRSLSLTSENSFKATVLQNSFMSSDSGWIKENYASYDNKEKAYLLPDEGSNIHQKVEFHQEVGYRLLLNISARNVGDAAESNKLGVMIKISGSRMSSTGDEFWLRKIEEENNRYAWSSSEGYFAVDLPEPSDSESKADATDVEIVIPLYWYDGSSYAYASSMEITLFNATGVHDIYIYECSLQQYEQPRGHKISASIANRAREVLPDVELALNDGDYAQPAAEVFRNAVPIAYDSGAIIKLWKTPFIAEGSYLSVMARDYAMQVALPRMRYKGTLNVPSMEDPRFPLLFCRDHTYYFLDTYSYDLLNDEMEVELISIPNAAVVIEAETITEISDPGAGGSAVGVDGIVNCGGASSEEIKQILEWFYQYDENTIGTKYSFFSEKQSAAGGIGEETGSGGGGIGTITGIVVNGKTYNEPDNMGLLTLPDYPTSLLWSDIEERPTELSAFSNDVGYIKEVTTSMLVEATGASYNAGKVLLSTGGGFGWTAMSEPDWDASRGNKNYIANRPFWATWKYNGSNISVSNSETAIQSACTTGSYDILVATVRYGGHTQSVYGTLGQIDATLTFNLSSGGKITFRKSYSTLYVSSPSSGVIIESLKITESANVARLPEMYIPTTIARTESIQTWAEERYLKLSGGTIEGEYNAFSIKRNSSKGAYVEFKNNNGIIGYLGINGSGSPLILNADSTEKGVLIHSGNIGSYNAGSATKLQTARTIWGQSFDGTGNVKGHIYGSNKVFAIYGFDGTNNYNILDADTNNSNLWLGYGSAPKSYNTNICGNVIYLKYGTGRANGLILNSSGNVTIGSSDLAGTAQKLCVGGSVKINGSIYFGVDTITMYGYDSSDSSTVNALYLSSVYKQLQIGYGTAANGYNTYLYGNELHLRYGTSRTTGIILKSSGNVGIGTTDPQYKLDVNGTVRISGAVTMSSTLKIGGATLTWDSANNALKIEGNVYSTGQMASGGIGEEGDNIATYDKWGGLKPAYSTTGKATLTTASASFTNSPTIAARTTTEGRYYAVEMDSVGRAFVNVPWTDTNYWTLDASVSRIYPKDAARQLCVGGTGNSAYSTSLYKLVVHGSAFAISGSWQSSSDMTMKDIVKETTLDIKDIAAAPSFVFKWKGSEDNTEWLGTSAQYWKAILPTAVKGEDGSYSLCYGELALTTAIAIAKKTMNHEERIKELELQITTLKRKLSVYEN